MQNTGSQNNSLTTANSRQLDCRIYTLNPEWFIFPSCSLKKEQAGFQIVSTRNVLFTHFEIQPSETRVLISISVLILGKTENTT